VEPNLSPLLTKTALRNLSVVAVESSRLMVLHQVADSMAHLYNRYLCFPACSRKIAVEVTASEAAGSSINALDLTV
jgi:hypothetical protein